MTLTRTPAASLVNLTCERAGAALIAQGDIALVQHDLGLAALRGRCGVGMETWVALSGPLAANQQPSAPRATSE